MDMTMPRQFANGAITRITHTLVHPTAITVRSGSRAESLLVRALGTATDGVTQATTADAITVDHVIGTAATDTAIVMDIAVATAVTGAAMAITDTGVAMVIAVATAAIAAAALTVAVPMAAGSTVGAWTGGAQLIWAAAEMATATAPLASITAAATVVSVAAVA